MDVTGKGPLVLIVTILFTLTATYTASANPAIQEQSGLANQSQVIKKIVDIEQLRPTHKEHPEHSQGYQPKGSSDPIESKSFNIDQEDITDSGMLKGEHIDTRTGKLHWEVTELQIPGNGGMDINISRSFEKGGDSWRPHFGNYGSWEIEIPRIEIPQTPEALSRGQSGNRGICIDPKPADQYLDSKDEMRYWTGMQLLMPNAAPRPIYLRHKNAKHFAGAKYVTEDNWVIKCARDEDGLWGYFTVQSPDGKTYQMRKRGVQGGIDSERGMQIYYVTEERDKSDNWIKYEYSMWWGHGFSGNKTPFVKRITASDGREVHFEYGAYYPRYGNGDFKRLKAIKYADKEWRYYYDKDNSLHRAVRPDGTESRYEYQEYKKRFGGYLRTVTTPQGAKISYTYKEWYIRNFGASSSKYRHKLVSQRRIEGPGIKTSEWHYSLSRDDAKQENITQIKGPTHTERHYFHRTQDWKHGLKKRQAIYPAHNLQEQPLKVIDYEWAPKSTIGFTEAYVKSSYYFTTIGVPKVLTKRTINGRYQTEYEGHDDYGKPGKIIEQGDKTRITKLTYEHRPKAWLIGLPKSESIEGGSTTTRAYNDKGQVSQENRNGQITRYSYHATGDMASKCWQKDQQEQCESYQDYKRGKPQSTRDAKGHMRQQSINAMGSITNETDKEGHTTEYAYDKLERIKHIKPPIQAEVHISWPTPRRREIQQGNKRSTTYYNAMGKVIKEKQEDQITGEVIYTHKDYDAIGRNIYESKPSHIETGEGKGIQKAYDALSRLTKVTEIATGAKTQYCYDQCQAAPGMQLGRVITNSRGYISKEYQEAYGDPSKGQKIRIEQQVGNGQADIITQMQYNTMGKLTRVSQGAKGDEAKHYKRSYQYNAQQRLETETHPETGTTTYTYDEVGNVKSRTQGGQSIQYDYDANNQLAQEEYANQQVIKYAYDKNGQLKQIRNQSSQRDYQYNALGQLTKESLQIGQRPAGEAEKNYQIGYQYNQDGSLVAVTYPNGENSQITPDGFGRERQIAGLVDQVDYYASQNIRSLKLSNGTETRREQNQAQLPKQIITENLVTGETIQDSHYQYDSQYNIIQIEDKIKAQIRTMQYDGIDRLVREESQKTQENYHYDAHGNLLKKTGENSKHYQYHQARNQLTSVNGKVYEYDTQGNITKDGNNQYQYNLAKRLVRIKDNQNQMQEYQYDGHGYRIRRETKNGITYEVHNKAGQLIYEESEAGKSTSYHYLKDNLIAKITNAPGLIPPTNTLQQKSIQQAVQYLHTNLQGSIEAATDEAGKLQWREGYAAYGTRTNKEQPEQEAILSFTGKLEDSSTGLVYMNARYYDPDIGRFLAIDPVGFTPKNLQSFNRYLYVNNNPYKYKDPTGEFLQAVTMTVGAIAGGYWGYHEKGGSIWGAVQGAATGAYIGSGVGGLVRGAGMAARAITRHTALRSIGTDSAIGAVSSFSGTKAIGGSTQDAFKNAGFGALFGAITGRLGKSKTLLNGMLRSGGLGAGTNAITQATEIAFSDTKTKDDFKFGSVISSGVAGAITGGINFHAPNTLVVNLASAPRNTMIDSSITSVGNRLLGAD